MSSGIIHTARLVMKPLALSDAPFMLQLLNTPSWLHYIGDRNVHSIADAERYLTEGSIKCLERDGYGYYLLTEKDNNQVVGVCGLGKREGLEATDLGYALLPEFEKQGFAMESAQALIEAARDTFHLKTLLAITTENNSGSMRLLEKLNFHLDRAARLEAEGEIFLHFKLVL